MIPLVDVTPDLPVVYRTSSMSYGLWGVGFGFFTAVAIGVTTVDVLGGRSPENLPLYAFGLLIFSIFSGYMLLRALRPRIEFRLDAQGLAHRSTAPIPWHRIDGATVGYSEGEGHVIVHLKQDVADENALNRDAAHALCLPVSFKTKMTEVSPEQLAHQINVRAGNLG